MAMTVAQGQDWLEEVLREMDVVAERVAERRTRAAFRPLPQPAGEVRGRLAIWREGFPPGEPPRRSVSSHEAFAWWTALPHRNLSVGLEGLLRRVDMLLEALAPRLDLAEWAVLTDACGLWSQPGELLEVGELRYRMAVAMEGWIAAWEPLARRAWGVTDVFGLLDRIEGAGAADLLVLAEIVARLHLARSDDGWHGMAVAAYRLRLAGEAEVRAWVDAEQSGERDAVYVAWARLRAAAEADPRRRGHEENPAPKRGAG